MTDLHCHILPGMDDGPKALEDALAMLHEQFRQGVDHIALTSHYHCELEEPEAFLHRREMAFAALAARVPEAVTLKRGCEVFFSPRLLELDVGALCLEGTNVLLLELPVLQKPAFLREVLTGLRQRGVVPLIAHAERYAYVAADPALLARWISLGALIQVNGESVLEGGRMVRKLVKWGLVHVIASDVHSLRYRPPNLRRALECVSASSGLDLARTLERNARLIFAGKPVPKTEVHVPRRVLGVWV